MRRITSENTIHTTGQRACTGPVSDILLNRPAQLEDQGVSIQLVLESAARSHSGHLCLPRVSYVMACT